MRNAYIILSENLNGRNHLEELGIDERISKWILKKQDMRILNGIISLSG
jgi:hypothetical protein